MQVIHARRLYIGTSAERAATTPPVEAIGVRWWDTGELQEYVWSGTLWKLVGSSSGFTYSAENKGGTTILDGMAAAVHTSGVGVVKASAADNSKPAVGLAVLFINPAASGGIQTEGVFELANWTDVIGAASLTAKAIYYLDPATAGMLTATAPTTTGQVVQVVGRAVSTTKLDIEIGDPILL